MHSKTEVLSGVINITYDYDYDYYRDYEYDDCDDYCFSALQDRRPLRGDEHHLLAGLRSSWNFLLELHDQLLVAG